MGRSSSERTLRTTENSPKRASLLRLPISPGPRDSPSLAGHGPVQPATPLLARDLCMRARHQAVVSGSANDRLCLRLSHQAAVNDAESERIRLWPSF